MRHMALLRSSVSLVTLVAVFSLVASPGCKSSPPDETQQLAPEKLLEYDTGVFAVRQGPQELLGDVPQAYLWRDNTNPPAVEVWALLDWHPAGSKGYEALCLDRMYEKPENKVPLKFKKQEDFMQWVAGEHKGKAVTYHRHSVKKL